MINDKNNLNFSIVHMMNINELRQSLIASSTFVKLSVTIKVILVSHSLAIRTQFFTQLRYVRRVEKYKKVIILKNIRFKNSKSRSRNPISRKSSDILRLLRRPSP